MRFITWSIALVVMGSSIANADAPTIVSRKDWGAQAPNEVLMHAQIPRGIVVHHSGEERNVTYSLEEKLRFLQEFSMVPGVITETQQPKPAWGDVPYHFYIDAVGRTGEGREIKFAGDTNTDYDTDGYIQIVVEGDFNKEQLKEEQVVAFDSLVRWLAEAYRINPDDITAHDDHAATDCPGAYLEAHIDELRKEMKNTQ
ncbi:N-acetylmuramoyl-L-alanine amidase [Candidatus Kaiserbacteria bacterium]|nr:N-acetylmuramoyl-L-alanine amidase [Candidatus Kaiserbacteria bacterium]